MRLKIDKMEHFHQRNIGQIGHLYMNFYYARYQKVKKSVPPNIKNEASDHLNDTNNPDELLNQRRLYYLLPKKIAFTNQNFAYVEWEQ